jgi:ABC-2 type transport system permease protein
MGLHRSAHRLAYPQRCRGRLRAVLLLLMFGFAMVWLGIWVGSLMRSVEGRSRGFMFTVMFPLTFVANTFAPTDRMPSWLRFVAEWNPVSSLTQACRELWGNGPSAPAGARGRCITRC